MANRMFVDKLVRLTLTTKGATAKHPALRRDVVEVVKATERVSQDGTPALDRFRSGRWG